MPPPTPEQLREKFVALCDQPIDDQVSIFLTSFIFALPEWQLIPRLAEKFLKYIKDAGETGEVLNHIQASDFLQQNGLERTGLQRKEELTDIDLNDDKLISFIEYLLLHFKQMILEEYWKRHEISPEIDFSEDSPFKNAVGVVGVGDKLLEELFTMPVGIPPELQQAIDDFTDAKKARAARVKALTETASGGGVKAFAAKNELEQMDSEDKTESNRLELTLEAARRKAQKQGSGAEALDAKKKAQEKEEREKKEAGRAKMKSVASMWENN